MIEFTPKMGSRRLYVGQLCDSGGAELIRAVFAKTPTEAVQKFKRAFPGLTVWVSRLKVIDEIPPKKEAPHA